jgi:hypothetical protein
MIPTIKSKITSFVLSEKGKISKQSLISLGSFMSAAVIGGILMSREGAANHTNSISTGYTSPNAWGEHSHHASHVSHSSHGSHASHTSHGSHGSHSSHSSHGSGTTTDGS